MRLMILGTGGMANSHAAAFSTIEGVEITACTDVNPDAARDFADQHDINVAHNSLEDALNAGGFDAVANVTPDAIHHPTTMKLLDAGLHVFCEKPLASNFGHASEMAEAAASRGLINGVNLTYRNVAALQKAHEMIAAGEIGTVRHIEASYLQSWLTQPAWGDWKTEKQWLWRLSTEHGSTGALGDIGIHVVDFASYATGSRVASLTCQLKTFDKAPDNQIGEYKLDANDAFNMTVEMENEAVGVIHATRFASGHINDLSLRVFGDKGGLEVTNYDALGTLRGCIGNDMPSNWAEIPLSPVETTYQRFARAVRTGEPMDPDFAIAASHQKVLDGAMLASDVGGKIEI